MLLTITQAAVGREFPEVPVLILWSIASKAAAGGGGEAEWQETGKMGSLKEKTQPHGGGEGRFAERWQWTQSVPKGGLCLSFL